MKNKAVRIQLTEAEREEDIKNMRYLFDQAETKAVYVQQVALKDKNNPDGDQKRYLKLFVIGRDSYPMNITKSTAGILGWEYDSKTECIIVHGCGMDMHFHTVYSLSSKLYGYANSGGYTLKQFTL